MKKPRQQKGMYQMPNGKKYRFITVLHLCAKELGVPPNAGKRAIANAMRERFPEMGVKSHKKTIIAGAKRLFGVQDVVRKTRKSGHKKRCKVTPIRPNIPRQTDYWIPEDEYRNFYKTREWKQLRYLALRNAEGRCECCGATSKDGTKLHVDHIKPRASRPDLQLSLDNLQVLCAECNLGKGAWDDTDWRGATS